MYFANHIIGKSKSKIALTNFRGKGEHNLSQAALRKQLISAINDIGLKATAISKKTGILQSDISLFKNGKIELCLSDFEKLRSFLDSFKAFY